MIVATEEFKYRTISGVKRKFINCLCNSCGKNFYAREDHIKREKNPIKSCGCKKKEKTGRVAYNAKPEGVAAAKCVFNSYIGKCKNKNILFSLTFDEFVKETSKNCFYCNEPPKQEYSGFFKRGIRIGLKKVNGTYKYNGLDRIKPELGYIMTNVRPCCRYCNSAKLDRTEEDFYSWIERLYRNKEKFKCQ